MLMKVQWEGSVLLRPYPIVFKWMLKVIKEQQAGKAHFVLDHTTKGKGTVPFGRGLTLLDITTG